METVPRASLIEVRPDGALVAHKTNFAIASESTRFTFQSRSKGGSKVRAESSSGGALGFASYPKLVAETGRAVLDALVNLGK